MREVIRSALVPYTPAQMFALVEDIERYPEFIPWVAGAQLLERSEDLVVGRLQMERAGVRETFTTRNRLCPAERMDIELVDGPFRMLEGHWTFEPIADRGTKIGLAIRFEFASPVTALLLTRAFEKSCSQLVDAFVARARSLYAT